MSDANLKRALADFMEQERAQNRRLFEETYRQARGSKDDVLFELSVTPDRYYHCVETEYAFIGWELHRELGHGAT